MVGTLHTYRSSCKKCTGFCSLFVLPVHLLSLTNLLPVRTPCSLTNNMAHTKHTQHTQIPNSNTFVITQPKNNITLLLISCTTITIYHTPQQSFDIIIHHYCHHSSLFTTIITTIITTIVIIDSFNWYHNSLISLLWFTNIIIYSITSYHYLFFLFILFVYISYILLIVTSLQIPTFPYSCFSLCCMFLISIDLKINRIHRFNRLNRFNISTIRRFDSSILSTK